MAGRPHGSGSNSVATRLHLKIKVAMLAKTKRLRCWPWADDVERHVDGCSISPEIHKKARAFADQYRRMQAKIGGDEPPCCSCRNNVIWFCSETGFECKQSKTYSGKPPKKEKDDEE